MRSEMPLARPHPAVVRHAVISRVRAVPQPAARLFIDHVHLDAAEEVNGALVAAAFPKIEIDPGLVLDQEHPCSLGHSLAQAPGCDPL